MRDFIPILITTIVTLGCFGSYAVGRLDLSHHISQELLDARTANANLQYENQRLKEYLDKPCPLSCGMPPRCEK